MADDDEDNLNVEVSLAPEGESAAPEEDAAVADLSKQVADMKAQSEANASARRAAEARAAQMERVARQAHTEASDTRAQTVVAQIAAAEAEGTAAEEAYAKAMDQGNFAEAAKAQRRMAKAESAVDRLTASKVQMDLQGQQGAQPQQQYQQPVSTDPVDAFISSKTEPTANWLRAHRDWVTDEAKSAKITAAHWDAVSKKIALDSPEYFDSVERYIGLKGDATAATGAAAPAGKRRAAMPPVAGPNSGRTGSAVQGDTVFLTKREAENAEDGTLVWNYDDPSPAKRFRKGDPIGRQEYARRKRELAKEGRYRTMEEA